MTLIHRKIKSSIITESLSGEPGFKSTESDPKVKNGAKLSQWEMEDNNTSLPCLAELGVCYALKKGKKF